MVSSAVRVRQLDIRARWRSGVWILDKGDAICCSSEIGTCRSLSKKRYLRDIEWDEMAMAMCNKSAFFTGAQLTAPQRASRAHSRQATTSAIEHNLYYNAARGLLKLSRIPFCAGELESGKWMHVIEGFSGFMRVDGPDCALHRSSSWKTVFSSVWISIEASDLP